MSDKSADNVCLPMLLDGRTWTWSCVSEDGVESLAENLGLLSLDCTGECSPYLSASACECFGGEILYSGSGSPAACSAVESYCGEVCVENSVDGCGAGPCTASAGTL